MKRLDSDVWVQLTNTERDEWMRANAELSLRWHESWHKTSVARLSQGAPTRCLVCDVEAEGYTEDDVREWLEDGQA